LVFKSMLPPAILRHPILSTVVLSMVVVLVAAALSVVSYQMLGEARPGVLYEALSAFGIAALLAPTFLYPWIRTAAKLRGANVEIATLAAKDNLTGLPNALVFTQRLKARLADMGEGGQFAVMFVDLDQFKQVNDTLGHPRGDAVLMEVAARLAAELRESDVAARFSGDEFVVLQWPLSTAAAASSLAGRLIAALSAPYEVDGQEIVIGASVGIAIAPGDGVEPHQLLRNADMALSRAKAHGKRTWRFFESTMAQALQARRNLELELRSALLRGGFELYYQPIVELKTRRVVACEALIRWRGSDQRMILPAEFIAVAEQIGIITEIGTWVLREACAACSRWPQGVRVAVNLSSIQLTRGDIVKTVTETLRQTNLPAGRLELEITESVLLHDFVAVRAMIERLRRLGVRVALDDFGTGYSSLSYLQSLPFDKVKIDRSFVSGLRDSERSLTLLKGVSRLSQSLGMTVVAEGVETEEQLEELKRLGCTRAQGYLLARPMTAAGVARFLSRLTAPSATAD
jgi:diguanylate cyclase (GGDEF)-like protein